MTDGGRWKDGINLTASEDASNDDDQDLSDDIDTSSDNQSDESKRTFSFSQSGNNSQDETSLTDLANRIREKGSDAADHSGDGLASDHISLGDTELSTQDEIVDNTGFQWVNSGSTSDSEDPAFSSLLSNSASSSTSSMANTSPSQLETTIQTNSSIMFTGSIDELEYYQQYISLVVEAIPDLTNIVTVSMMEGADPHIAVWQQSTQQLPANLHVVSFGGQNQSADNVTTIFSGKSGYDVTIRNLADQRDLTRLGIALNQDIVPMTKTGGQTLLSFHSLTATLQYVDPSRLFRFIHLLQGKVEQVGVLSHYHLNPAAHDERIVRTFNGLFDSVITFDGEQFSAQK